MTLEAKRQWYVLRVPPQSELRIGHEFRIRGHAVLVPFEEKWENRKRAGKANKPRRFPILARYVFIEGMPSSRHMDEIQPQPIKPLSFDGEPATLKPSDVDYLRALKSSDVPKGFNLHKAIKEGELARIASGPFRGFEGKVGRVTKTEAEMSVSIFGQPTKATVGLDQLEAA